MTFRPWEMEYANLFETWLRASYLAGLVEENKFDYDDLIPMVDNAERLELLGDMSREKAILLIGLWMGRYLGNQESGLWKPKIYVGEDEIEIAKEACQEFLWTMDDPNSKPFFESLARLLVALKNLHPENVI